MYPPFFKNSILCHSFSLATFLFNQPCSAEGLKPAITTIASNKNDAEAQYNLARKYVKGEGVPKDEKKGFDLMKQSADQGFADAIGGMGYFYDNGIVVQKDQAMAAEWFGKGAEKGSAKAQYNLARLLTMGPEGVKGDIPKAISLYEKAADSGLLEAQVALGKIYYFGDMEGIAKDYAKAGIYIETAAKQGSAWAQNALGVLFESGLSREQDYSEAAKWFQKGADQNDGMAQANLGLLYIDGRGVKKDWTTAYMWLWCSSYLNVPNGFNALKDFKRGVSPQVQSEGIRRAKEFLKSKGVEVVLEPDPASEETSQTPDNK